VDGVRRIEHRLLLEEGEHTFFGLLGSFGVGAVELRGRSARVRHEEVARICVAGGGLLPPPLSATVRGGRTELRFTPATVADNTPVAPVAGLQNAMRQGEALLAERLGRDGDLVLLDGPLTYLAATRSRVLGFVKRLLRPYLASPHSGLLRQLGVGERTPLFVIQDPRAPRYSWYSRLAKGRSIQSPLTGVVRLETSGTLALNEVKALADAACRLLPHLASDAAHDPRAPHNLHPIGGLEARLRRLLGDPLLVRRSIEAQLHRQVEALP
jgi:hypothetical protein